jgi:hypothetical protein
MEYRGAGMEWIEILLGTGLLGTVAGFIYREGKHRERFVIMEKRMDLQDEKMEIIKENVHAQDIVQATILTSLDYIKTGIDDLRKSKEDRRHTDGK